MFWGSRTGGWVGDKNKFECVPCKWMGLITTSLELHCMNYFLGKETVCLFALLVVVLINRVSSKIRK